MHVCHLICGFYPAEATRGKIFQARLTLCTFAGFSGHFDTMPSQERESSRREVLLAHDTMPSQERESSRREVLLAHAAAITAMAIFGGYNVIAKVIITTKLMSAMPIDYSLDEMHKRITKSSLHLGCNEYWREPSDVLPLSRCTRDVYPAGLLRRIRGTECSLPICITTAAPTERMPLLISWTGWQC
jgi:hypothetical protein